MRAHPGPFISLMFASYAACAQAAAPAAPAPHSIAVNGHRLEFHVLPGRLPAPVAEAGGGADSGYWDSIIPALAQRTGSEIISYDRAGLGASDETPPPFNMQDAVGDLAAGLQQLGATRELVLVPHSFAGEIATGLVLRHPGWVAGAVLVDTNVPEFFTDAEINRLDPLMRPLVAAELKAHPGKTTRTLQAIASAYAPTSRAFHMARWPESIPCTVIVSDGTPFLPSMPGDAALWKQAHADFAKAAPNRRLIVAKGSPHDIAHAAPGIIVQEVGFMVDRLRAASTPPGH